MISNPEALLPMFDSFGAEEKLRYIALVSSPYYSSMLTRGGSKLKRQKQRKAAQCVETGIIYESYTAAAIAMTGKVTDSCRVGAAINRGCRFHGHYWRLV